MSNKFFSTIKFIILGTSILAGSLVYLLYSNTREQIAKVNARITAIELEISRIISDSSFKEESEKNKYQLVVLCMERLLFPIPWALQIEIVKNGFFAFIENMIATPEKRKARLKKIVSDSSRFEYLDYCPDEFIEMYKGFILSLSVNTHKPEDLQERLAILNKFFENYKKNSK